MAAVAEVLSRAFPATTTLQPNTNIDVLLSADKMERLGTNVKEHLILGTNKRDAEEQRDLWLSENRNPPVRAAFRAATLPTIVC